jgi:hypothetical protein
MNRKAAFVLSILPILMIAGGVYQYFNLRPFEPSAAQRYEKLIIKAADNCTANSGMQQLLKLSAESDITSEEIIIILSDMLKDSCALFIFLGILQLCTIYYVTKRYCKSENKNL